MSPKGRPRTTLSIWAKNYIGIPPTLKELLDEFLGGAKDVFEINGKLTEEAEMQTEEIEAINIVVNLRHPGQGPSAIGRKLYKEATGREAPRGKESLRFEIKVKERKDPNQTELNV